MYFESLFIKPNNFYINICNITYQKNSWNNSLFLASKVGRPLKVEYDWGLFDSSVPSKG